MKRLDYVIDSSALVTACYLIFSVVPALMSVCARQGVSKIYFFVCC